MSSQRVPLATQADLAGIAAGNTPDATSTVKGKVQLAGDLAGTAAAPTVPGLAARALATDLAAETANRQAADALALLKTDRGSANGVTGVAPLDATGKVPASFLPSGAGAAHLTDLLDMSSNVEPTVDKQVVRFNATTGKWDFVTENLGDLGDVAKPAGGFTDQVYLQFSITAGKWQGTYHMQVFDVRNYIAAHAAGDNAAAANDAYAAQQATGQPGVIYFAPGVWTGLAGSVATSWIPLASGGTPCVITGAGRRITTIQLNAQTTNFVNNGTSLINGLYGNVAVFDLCIDKQNLTAAGPGVIVQIGASSGSPFYIANVHIERVRTINLGLLHTGNGNRSVNLVINAATTMPTGPTGPYSILNVTIRDCRFGDSGGGGNTGVLIGVFISATQNTNVVFNTPNYLNAIVDNIVIERMYWNSGAMPIAFQSSSGIQVGGSCFCGTVTITDVELWNPGDVAIELDSVMDATITRARAFDAWNQPFLAINFSMLPDSTAQTIRWIDCEATYSNQTNANGVYLSPAIAGFYMNSKWGTPYGHLVMRGCVVNVEIPNRTTFAPVIDLVGPWRTVSMQSCRIHDTSLSWSPASTGQVRSYTPFKFQLYGARTLLTMNDVQFNMAGALVAGTGGFTGGQVLLTVFGMSNGTDVTYEATNCHYNIDLPGVAGTADAQIKGVNWSGVSTVIDSFAADTSTTDYVWDSGTMGTDLTVTAGVLKSAANAAVEKRLMWAGQSGTPTGPHQDMATQMKVTVGAVTTGFKAGVILKWLSATSFLEYYVYDDGTNSYQCLDKVSGATRTSLLGAIGSGGVIAVTPVAGANMTGVSDRGIALAARITAASTFWLRAAIIANTIWGNHYTAAPSGTLQGNTGATNGLTVTLAGADALTWGQYAPTLGRPALSFAPQDLTASVDDFTVYCGMVIRGTFNGVGPRFIRASTASLTQPIFASLPSQQGGCRIDGKLRFLNFDHSMLGNAGTVTDFSGPTDAQGANVYVGPGSSWWSKPAPFTLSTVTLASGGTFQNTKGYPLHYLPSGGTITAVQLSQDGTSFFGGNPAHLPLQPGDWVKPTFTGSPTHQFLAAV